MLPHLDGSKTRPARFAKMNFGIDGGTIGPVGIVLVLIVAALAFSIIRYNNFTRPGEERNIADARDAVAREHRAAHENDVLP